MNDKCKELVFIALGTASMCWNPRPGKQVFVSEEALDAGNQLIAALDKELAATTANSQSDAIALLGEAYEVYTDDESLDYWFEKNRARIYAVVVQQQLVDMLIACNEAIDSFNVYGAAPVIKERRATVRKQRKAKITCGSAVKCSDRGKNNVCNFTFGDCSAQVTSAVA